jgi:hypothetical protein
MKKYQVLLWAVILILIGCGFYCAIFLPKKDARNESAVTENNADMDHIEESADIANTADKGEAETYGEDSIMEAISESAVLGECEEISSPGKGLYLGIYILDGKIDV